MSEMQRLQSAEAMELWQPQGYGKVVRNAGPTNGQAGYSPGCEWVNFLTGATYVNVGTTTSSFWVENDPNSPNVVFGNSGGSVPSTAALMLGSGNIYRKVSAAGLTPAATGGNYVVDVYSLPANSLDGATGTNRGLTITAGGNITGSDASTVQLWWAPSAAVVGSTITGGTSIGTTGSMSQASKGWMMQSQVWKYGGANSNTQLSQMIGVAVATTHGGVGVPTTLTATENAAILIAVTINVTTTATDCSLSWWEISAFN